MKRIIGFLGLFVMLFVTSANTGGIDHNWVPTIYKPAIVEVEPKPVKMYKFCKKYEYQWQLSSYFYLPI